MLEPEIPTCATGQVEKLTGSENLLLWDTSPKAEAFPLLTALLISCDICYKDGREIYGSGLQDGLFTPGLPSQEQHAPQKCCVP